MTPADLKALLDARTAQRAQPHGKVCSCMDCQYVDSEVEHAAAKALPAFVALWEAATDHSLHVRGKDRTCRICEALAALKAMP